MLTTSVLAMFRRSDFFGNCIAAKGQWPSEASPAEVFERDASMEGHGKQLRSVMHKVLFHAWCTNATHQEI